MGPLSRTSRRLFKSYYQGLTIHGVLNALVWTTVFITGFLTWTTIVGLQPTSRLSETQQDRVLGDDRRGGHGRDPHPRRRGHRPLHVLPAHAGQLGLLPRSHPGGGRVVDRGLRNVLHVPGVAKRQSGCTDTVHQLRRIHHDGHVADRHPWDRRRDPHHAPAGLPRTHRRNRPGVGPNLLLVHRPPPRVLLAAACLRVVVRHAAASSRREALLGQPGHDCRSGCSSCCRCQWVSTTSSPIRASRRLGNTSMPPSRTVLPSRRS